ncbi:MAG: succinate dehydrogenase cytochrome b subunit [Bdellovibrionota bacterium]
MTCGKCESCCNSKFWTFLKSTVGRKFVMGLTGLMLAGFVFTHMAGNLIIIFKGADAYNLYGHSITSNPLYPLIGPGLLGIFIIHILTAISLSLENRKSRASKYIAGATNGEKAVPVASRTMVYSGTILLAFLISHLITFKYGTHYSTLVGDIEVRDLARLFFEVFTSPIYVVGYLISLIAVGLHLKHGFAAAFQSLGFWHPRYTPVLKCLAALYGIVVALGFMSQPLYAFFIYKQ